MGLSKLNYWEDCPGFMSGESSDRALVAAEEGQDNHDRMEVLIDRYEAAPSITLTDHLSALRREQNFSDTDHWLLHHCCEKLERFLSKQPQEYLQEQRVWLHDESGTQLTYGYYDLLLTYRERRAGILVDYKFGQIPVPPANDNAQGAGYALGVFQEYPEMERVLVVFIQPKTNSTTQHLYTRSDIPALIDRVKSAFAAHAWAMQAWETSDVLNLLNVSPYCKFCANATNCPKLKSQALSIVGRTTNLPMPKSFIGAELNTPEEAAVATYLCTVLEDAVPAIRKRALELAKANGGKISFVAPDGKEVEYRTAHRGMDRSLKGAVEVSEALKEMVDPMELMGAAKLAVTGVEKICGRSIQDLAAAMGEKITLKEARERAMSILESNGLVSRPDGVIEYLRLEKRAKPKKIKNKKQKTKVIDI